MTGYVLAEPRLHAPAPPVALAAPSVRFLDDRDRVGARSVTMHVTGPARASLIVLEADHEITDVTIDGTPVATRPVLNSGILRNRRTRPRAGRLFRLGWPTPGQVRLEGV